MFRLRNFQWRPLWRHILVGAVSAFLLGGAIASDPNGPFGSIVAAWIQAIGSVFAIGFAWQISQRQAATEHKRLLRQEAHTRSQRVSEVTANRTAGIALVFMAAERLQLMAENLDDPATRDLTVVAARGAIGAAINIIGNFPVHLLGDPTGIIQFSHVTGTLDVAQQSMLALESLETKDTDARALVIRETAANLRALSAHLHEKAEGLIAYYGVQAAFEGWASRRHASDELGSLQL